MAIDCRVKHGNDRGGARPVVIPQLGFSVIPALDAGIWIIGSSPAMTGWDTPGNDTEHCHSTA